MSTDTDNIQSSIDAGEYVLGTLDDVARARMERDMIFDTQLRKQVQSWENRLQPLADQVAPVEPPSAIWETIHARIIGEAPKSVLKSKLMWWKTLALGGIAASAAMAVVLTGALNTGVDAPGGQPAQIAQNASATTHPVSLAVVNDQQKDPMWVVQCYQQPPHVSVSVVPDEIPIRDKSLQLWALTKDGNTMFVGVVPKSGKRNIKVTPDMIKHINNVKAFAVSVEPMTGSPTNKPTGPVKYSGGLVML